MKNFFYGVNKRCKNDPEIAAGKGSDSQLSSERGPFAKIRKGHWKLHHPHLIRKHASVPTNSEYTALPQE